MARAERRRLALDSSCMVALVSPWHENHDVTRRAFEAAVAEGMERVVLGPALVETYSVLTRIPASRRVSPTAAMSAIEANFPSATRTLALTPAEYWSLLRRSVAGSVGGGRIYDAVIAACARKAAPATLLTLNAAHFAAFADAALMVITP